MRGMDVRAWKGYAEAAVKMLYLIPHLTIDHGDAKPERRMRLLEIAEEFDFAIVEDDYDYDFTIRLRLSAAGSRQSQQPVVYIGSFSNPCRRRSGSLLWWRRRIYRPGDYTRRLIELRGITIWRRRWPP